MMKFKVGDRVRLIDNSNKCYQKFPVGAVYTVTGLIPTTECIDTDGPCGAFESRFDLETSAPVVSQMKELSITVETYREYVYEDGYTYRVASPSKVFFKETDPNGSHRVVDANGVAHYIPRGWRVIRWLGDVIA